MEVVRCDVICFSIPTGSELIFGVLNAVFLVVLLSLSAIRFVL